jgi:YD repeat-containing protein
MKIKHAQKMVFLAAVITLTFLNLVPSFADTIYYTYDDLNRLIRVENVTTGKVIEYQYDAVGNRLGTSDYLTITATAGSNGSISPSGSVMVLYNTNKTFTMTPNSGYEIQNVVVDSVAQTPYSSYTFSNVTANHTISVTFIAYTSPVTVGGTNYSTIQAVYDAASDGATIKVRNRSLTESLNVNRNISVTLDGGYTANFTNKIGTTSLKGTIRTYSGGGTITIKDFTLTQ